MTGEWFDKGDTISCILVPWDGEDEGPPVELDPAMRKQGAIVLCNRAAAYMADSKPIPALADAQRASDVDPSNWKSHWRVGLALMMMKPRLERSEQERPARMRRARHPTPRRCLPAAHASYRAAAKLARRSTPAPSPATGGGGLRACEEV